MQNTYAVSIAETVNTYEKLKASNAVVEKRKERQTQTAPYLNQQLSICNVEDIFHTLSEIYGCANWAVKKIEDMYVAEATSLNFVRFQRRWAEQIHAMAGVLTQ